MGRIVALYFLFFPELLMRELNESQITEIRNLVFEFFSEECDIPRARLTESTDIIKELEGDSLMFLSLLEIVRKKYDISIALKTIGKHLMKNPASTIGQVITLTTTIVQHGNDISSMDD